jgi:hypothetical protein
MFGIFSPPTEGILLALWYSSITFEAVDPAKKGLDWKEQRHQRDQERKCGVASVTPNAHWSE